MATYKQSMAPSNVFPQSRVNTGDRMLGAAFLSLVLGIWITLVQQGLTSAASQPGHVAATADKGLAAVAAQVPVAQVLDATSGRAAETRTSPLSRD